MNYYTASAKLWGRLVRRRCTGHVHPQLLQRCFRVFAVQPLINGVLLQLKVQLHEREVRIDGSNRNVLWRPRYLLSLNRSAATKASRQLSLRDILGILRRIQERLNAFNGLD